MTPPFCQPALSVCYKAIGGGVLFALLVMHVALGSWVGIGLVFKVLSYPMVYWKG